MEQDQIHNRADEAAPFDPLGEMKEAAGAAGKTVVAAALAGAVASGAAAVTPDAINLPEPVPIVQTVDTGVDLPDSTVDDQEQKKASAIKRLLQILKYALIALFMVAAFLFAMLQGCAACTGQFAAPILSSDASSSAVEAEAQTESSADADAAATVDADADTSAADDADDVSDTDVAATTDGEAAAEAAADTDPDTESSAPSSVSDNEQKRAA